MKSSFSFGAIHKVRTQFIRNFGPPPPVRRIYDVIHLLIYKAYALDLELRCDVFNKNVYNLSERHLRYNKPLFDIQFATYMRPSC